MNGVKCEPAENDLAVFAREKGDKARAEFAKRRRILITNLPGAVDEEDLKQNFLNGYDVKELKVNGNTATVLLADAPQAREAVSALNNQSFHECEVGLSFTPPDALLFVGNLPFEFTEEEFRELMSPFGPVERLFLVCSERTGKSKGYGFVEFLNQGCAIEAKQSLMSSGSKYVGGRILRIDFAQPNLISYDDLHSKTLFVDRLPRNLIDGEKLNKHFAQSGTVLFAQVAVNSQTGMSRGFAFVDFMTSEDAEKAQEALNGSELEGSHIRVAFGTPGRSGSGILGSQLKNAGMGRGLSGGLSQVRALLGPRPLMCIDTGGPRHPGGLLGPKPPMYRQALLGHGPRPVVRPGLLGRPHGPNWASAPGAFSRGSLLGMPRVEPRPLFGRFTGPRGLLGAKPQPPKPPQPLMSLLESAPSLKKERTQFQAGGLLKDPTPMLLPLPDQENTSYLASQPETQTNDQPSYNQPSIPPQILPQPKQPLLQVPPVVPTQQTAQVLTGQQAQQVAVNAALGYPAAAVQGTVPTTSVPGVPSLMSVQPANHMIAAMTPSPILPSLMSVPVAAAGTNYLTSEPQYMSTTLDQQSALVTQVFSAQPGTTYLQPQQDPTQPGTTYLQPRQDPTQPGTTYLQPQRDPTQPQPLMYAQPVLQLQGYPQYMTPAQQQQQQQPQQPTLVPAQPQMLVQPGTAVQFQYQWPQATQPAAQAAVGVASQPTQASLVAPGVGTGQWQQGVVSGGSVVVQQPTVPQVAAYTAQYSSYQQPVVAVNQQTQPAAVETALLQQPQVVAPKRPAEGSADPGPCLAQDQSIQYYEAKRPRF